MRSWRRDPAESEPVGHPYRTTVYPPLELESAARGIAKLVASFPHGRFRLQLPCASDELGQEIAHDRIQKRTSILTRLGRGSVYLAGLALRQRCDCGREPHTVAVPSYHCGSEVAALSGAGLRTAFYRVRGDLSIDPDSFAEVASSACAVYVISFFGWHPHIDGIWPNGEVGPEMLARAKSTVGDKVWIEDAAHAFHSDYPGGVPVGYLGDIGIFSLRKSLGSPDGGGLCASSDWHGLLEDAWRSTVDAFRVGREQSRSRRFSRFPIFGSKSRWGPLLAQVWMRAAAGAGATAAIAASVLERVSKTERAAASGDLTSAIYGLDSDTSWRISEEALQRAALEPHYLSIAVFAGHRRAAAAASRRQNYVELVEGMGLGEFVPEAYRALPSGVAPLFVPLEVSDRAQAVRSFYARGIRVIEVWPTAHPDTPEAFARELKRARECLIGLPCHHLLSWSALEHVGLTARSILATSRR